MRKMDKSAARTRALELLAAAPPWTLRLDGDVICSEQGDHTIATAEGPEEFDPFFYSELTGCGGHSKQTAMGRLLAEAPSLLRVLAGERGAETAQDGDPIAQSIDSMIAAMDAHPLERLPDEDSRALCRVPSEPSLSEQSAAMTSYLALEEALLRLDEPGADTVRDLMDGWWWKMSEDERTMLNNRG